MCQSPNPLYIPRSVCLTTCRLRNSKAEETVFVFKGKLTVSGCCFLLSSKSKIACLSVNIGVLVSIEFVVHSSISDTIFMIVLPAQWNGNQQSLASRIMNDYE